MNNFHNGGAPPPPPSQSQPHRETETEAPSAAGIGNTPSASGAATSTSGSDRAPTLKKRKKAKPKGTKYTGVFETAGGRFQARKLFRHNYWNIGTFDTTEEAVLAVKEMSMVLLSKHELPEALSKQETKAVFDDAKEKVLKIVASKRLDEGTSSACQSNSPEELGTAASSQKDGVKGAHVAAIDNSSATSSSHECKFKKSQNERADDETVPADLDTSKEMETDGPQQDSTTQQNNHVSPVGIRETSNGKWMLFYHCRSKHHYTGTFDTKERAEAVRLELKRILEEKDGPTWANGLPMHVVKDIIKGVRHKAIANIIGDRPDRPDNNTQGTHVPSPESAGEVSFSIHKPPRQPVGDRPDRPDNNTHGTHVPSPESAGEVSFNIHKPPMQPVIEEGTRPLCNNISELNMHDVLLGRGGRTNEQVGNRLFRELVADFQPTYLLAKRSEKPLLARSIVLIIRKRGGRFVKKDNKSGQIFEVGDHKAEAKTSQAIREGLDVRATKGTKYTGVFETQNGQFRARKSFCGSYRTIGAFDTIDKAKMAVKEMSKMLPSMDELPEGLSNRGTKAIFDETKKKVLKVVAPKKLPPGIRKVSNGQFELRFTFRGKTNVVGTFDFADEAVFVRKILKEELAKIIPSTKMSMEDIETAFNAAKEKSIVAAKEVALAVQPNLNEERHVSRELEKSPNDSSLSEEEADSTFQKAIRRDCSGTTTASADNLHGKDGANAADSKADETGYVNIPRQKNDYQEEDILYISFGKYPSCRRDCVPIKLSECVTCSYVEGKPFVSKPTSPDDSELGTSSLCAPITDGAVITPLPSAKRRKLLDNSNAAASFESASMDLGSLVHEFLLSLHESIIPENLFVAWNGYRSLRIIDLEAFETVHLPKIRYWKEIKAMYHNFETFAEACGFEVWKKQCGQSLHTYIKHTRFHRLNVEGICQIAREMVVLDEQVEMSSERPASLFADAALPYETPQQPQYHRYHHYPAYHSFPNYCHY